MRVRPITAPLSGDGTTLKQRRITQGRDPPSSQTVRPLRSSSCKDTRLQTAPPLLDHIAPPLRHLAVAIDTLNLDPANARRHDEKNLAAIQGSLARLASACRWWSSSRA